MHLRIPRGAGIALLAFALTFTSVPLSRPAEAQASTVATVQVSSANLNAVEFVTDQLVVAVGSSGTVLRSTAGGAPGTWVKATQMPGGAHELTGVSFIDADRGWTISQTGMLFYTTDAGKTWAAAWPGNTIFPSQGSGVVYDLAVVKETLTGGDGITGLAAGRQGSSTAPATVLFGRKPPRDSVLYGEWNSNFQAKEYMPTGDFTEPTYTGTGEFYSVDVRMGATNPERAWAAGHDRYKQGTTQHNHGFIWTRTYDAVNRFSGSWTPKAKFTNSGPLYGVSFGSSTRGIAVGQVGKAWYTQNTGDSWTAATTGITGDLKAVAMSDANRAWAVGAAGRVTYSTNGGATWSAQTLSTPVDLRGVAARQNSTVAVAVGASGVIHYTSNGTTWQRADSSPPPWKVTGLASSSHSNPATWVKSATVALSWNSGSEYINGYSYRLDASSAAEAPTTIMTTSNSANVTAPSSGVWYARARAHDVWGQWGASSDPITVRVDVTLPVFTHDIDPSGYTEQADINISVADAHSGVTGFDYRIDGGSWQSVAATSKALNFDTVGTRTVDYRATDIAGNQATGSASVVVRAADAPPPPVMGAITSSSHPDSSTWYANSSVALAWDATGTGIQGYWYSIDPAATPSVMTASKSGTLAGVPSGTHTVYVRAKDAEVWSAAATRQVRVDVTPPRVSAAVVSQKALDGTVRLTAVDDHVGQIGEFKYRLATTDPWKTVSGSTVDVKFATSGTHTIYYSANDSVDNAAIGALEVTLDLPTAYTAIAGQNRYETAAKAVEKAFPTAPMAPDRYGIRTVILASGEAFPDALAASGLAGAFNAPLILTTPTSLRPEAKTQIQRLQAQRVIIVGGLGAVSKAVSDELAGMGLTVQREQDVDRYTTARKVAARIVSANTGWDGTAFVATGRDFPDALAAAPIAAAKGQPLYLFDSRSSVNDDTITQMSAHGVQRVVVLGGESAVSSSAYDALVKKFGQANVDRRAGTDRYATALDVAQYGMSVGLGWTNVALATGEAFPDALAGGVMQGKAGSVMLLTRPAKLSGTVKQALEANRDTIDEVRFLGGTSAVSAAVRSEVQAVVK